MKFSALPNGNEFLAVYDGGMSTRVRSRLKEPKRFFFREWRKFRQLTQEQLAERVEMSVASISQIETGKQGFTDATLTVLARELNCREGDLLMRNPLDKNAPWSLEDRLQRATPDQRRQALAVVEAIMKTGTDG